MKDTIASYDFTPKLTVVDYESFEELETKTNDGDHATNSLCFAIIVNQFAKQEYSYEILQSWSVLPFSNEMYNPLYQLPREKHFRAHVSSGFLDVMTFLAQFTLQAGLKIKNTPALQIAY